ncbi:MAG: zinc ribbon domain-containing protein, partial [Candidatus Heimdallarchaeota archaeon]
KLVNIYSGISASYAAQGFNLQVRIDNQDPTEVKLIASRVDVSYTLFAQILTAIIAIVGLILTVLSFIMGRGPRVPKAKPAPGGWEPTLQWGGGAAKQPKMAIKSTAAAPKKTKKVVKKAAPAAGAQQACKFCGKPVPASAFFCPHCYGKLR